MSEIGFLPFESALLFTTTHVNVNRFHYTHFPLGVFKQNCRCPRKGYECDYGNYSIDNKTSFYNADLRKPKKLWLGKQMHSIKSLPVHVVGWLGVRSA